MNHDNNVIPGPGYRADNERLVSLANDRLITELTKALESMCKDAQAVYTALAAGDTPTISVGMFGRLHTAQGMTMQLRSGGVVV